ncbi:hypothetical protein HGP28_12800 [Vibrio sp. SM6]|uniref:Uncharacterized protein n=1 Tax=Vibrio agarilyticus TaxID=2726741 RepID=A0A7X8TS28_9VIBR|nr:hypothetical protein [Vibrio agarilyticus]NLS13770.1 hypothetical protein [Vibrio agarilyticus]
MNNDEILPDATLAIEKFVELEERGEQPIEATLDVQPSDAFRALCLEGPDESYTGGYLVADQILDLASQLLDDYCDELVAQLAQAKSLDDSAIEEYRDAIRYYFKRGLAVACVDKAVESEYAATQIFTPQESDPNDDLLAQVELFMDSVAQVSQTSHTLGSQYVSEMFAAMLENGSEDQQDFE